MQTEARQRRRVAAAEPVGPYTLAAARARRRSSRACRASSSCSRRPAGCCRGRCRSASRRPASSPSSSTRSARERAALCRARAGDEIAVLGPLGNGFRLDVAAAAARRRRDRDRAAAVPRRGARVRRPCSASAAREHAEAAALVPGAEVVIDPVLVTEPIAARLATCSRAGRSRCSTRSRALCPTCAARVGGADGVRLRRLLRLRRRDRRRAQAPLPRGAGARRHARRRARGGGGVRILNASGCLDALAAPDVARQLDAFVTKTVTPLPREGSAPPRIAETAHGMLNAIGLANPGRERFLAEHLPRLRRARRSRSGCSVGGFCARRLRGDVLAADRHRGDRAQPLVPERRRGRRLGGGDRRRVPRGDRPAALREALRRASRTSRRSLARSPPRAPTGSRSSTRSAGRRSTSISARCSLAAAAVSRARR